LLATLDSTIRQCATSHQTTSSSNATFQTDDKMKFTFQLTCEAAAETCNIFEQHQRMAGSPAKTSADLKQRLHYSRNPDDLTWVWTTSCKRARTVKPQLSTW